MAVSGPIWLNQFRNGAGPKVSNFNRVKQWLVFSRQWYILDAKWQDPDLLATKIARYLRGSHKPIYNPLSDVGDHVVVYNTRHIAMKGFDWRRRSYNFNNNKIKGRVIYAAHQLHEPQPTRILYHCVYDALDRNKNRRLQVERLHLFPDAEVPDSIMANVTDQIQQVMPVPRKFEDHSKEEIDNFPSIVKLPDDLDENEVR